MTSVEIDRQIVVNHDDVFSGLYILSGNGEMIADGERQLVQKGDQFFIPPSVSTFEIHNQGNEAMRALRLFGPRVL
ncbi:cupin domain-containing protein [Bacillus sp. V3B]|uniref:cupin domain-containing protein n=1 Tax=Bacillus sp. V3B TaxID=2804915 RepID=UPI00210E6B55|nr:cupin domain-containing protein [Bacillus sp. V3B]MCQ6274976.1 cupin domain-containing protein [Bacillus sp. V3B]